MASAETIAIVKATVPVLKVHGNEITKVFYRRLFKYNPELKNIFNMTHQAKGTQPKVLANAIFQYASHIDQLEMLKGAVATMAQKHTSLSITPAMYPIVGKHLLEAIQEVLGEAATPEIIAAWAEAYGDLAEIMIGAEEEIYVERVEQEGGFRGQKEFVVLKKEEESAVITSFYLKPKDGTAVPSFLPGQYIALTVTIPGTTHKHTRNYSLSDAPNGKYWRISVKREGIVSEYLHQEVEAGAVLSLSMPSGEFVLEETNKPIVFLAGGVGITPLMSMYKTLKTKQPAVFVQCMLNSGTHAFRKEIASNDEVQSIVVYSQPLEQDKLGVDYDYKGYLNATLLEALLPTRDAEIYCCGPKAFMGLAFNLIEQLEIPEEQFHYEFFGPTELLKEELSV